MTAWTQRTWAGMKQEYLTSGEERVVLPEEPSGGQNTKSHSQLRTQTIYRKTSDVWRHSGWVLPSWIRLFCYIHCTYLSDSESKDLLLIKFKTVYILFGCLSPQLLGQGQGRVSRLLWLKSMSWSHLATIRMLFFYISTFLSRLILSDWMSETVHWTVCFFFPMEVGMTFLAVYKIG